MNLQIREENYSIKKAGWNDLNTVLNLLVQAAKWLQTKETTQWDYYLTNLEENTKEVKDSIANGNTYLLFREDRAVATITLEEIPNEWDWDIWQEEANEKNIMYIHRIVVHRDFSGKQIGSSLLRWAENKAREEGKVKIRFDCLHNNSGLNDYYQQYFILKDIAQIYGKHSMYEKIL